MPPIPAEKSRRRGLANHSKLWLLILPTALILSACSHNPLKAAPATQTTFLAPVQQLNPDSGETPFHHAYHTRDANLLRRASAARFLYIAPVRTDYLRPIRQGAGNAESEAFNYDRPVGATAARLKRDFIRAFQTSPRPRFLITGRPIRSGLTLELALVELNPTSPMVNFLRLPARLLSPILPFGLSSAAKGSVAIEGILRDNDSGHIVFAFADRERDQFSLFSVRDYGPYAHTDLALKNWAIQFEEYTRTPSRAEVADSLPVRFNPF